MTMLRLNNICKIFNAGRPNAFTAVSDVTLSVAQHEVCVLKGPSGSGKTTLLSILGGMTRPTSGRIMLNDREITSLPERFLTEIRRHTYGFIFQQFNLIKGITTLENVMAPAYPTGERHAILRKRALELLETFSVAGKSAQKVEFLSGGEAQRVAIARALINNPAVIIADEPTAHLDTKLSNEFMAIMKGLNQQGKTIIMASHDPIIYGADYATILVEMRDGAVISVSRPEKLQQ